MTNQAPHTTAFDCGDGVPDLPTLDHTVATVEAAGPQPMIGAGSVVLGLIVFGQLLLLVAVLAGGNALVGAVAGAALLLCGLAIVGARSLRRVLFGQ